MRIWQKTNVKNQVRIRGHAIAIAEADHGHQQRARVRILEARGNEMAKLMHVEPRRVDDRVRQQGCAGKVAFAGSVKFGKNGNEVHREVVYAVEAHVLKSAEDCAFARTGESGEDDELARVLSGGRLHRRAAQLFTRR